MSGECSCRRGYARLPRPRCCRRGQDNRQVGGLISRRTGFDSPARHHSPAAAQGGARSSAIGIHVEIETPQDLELLKQFAGTVVGNDPLVKVLTMLVGIDRKVTRSNVNEAQGLTLLGEINEQSTTDSLKLDSVVEALTEAGSDIQALLDRDDIPPAIAEGLVALQLTLGTNSAKVADVATTSAALAAAYEPPVVPVTPAGEVPGSAPLPVDDAAASPPADG